MLKERTLLRRIYIASNPLVVMLFGGGVSLEACSSTNHGALRWFRSLKELLPSRSVVPLAHCGRGLGRGVNSPAHFNHLSTKEGNLNTKRDMLPLLTGEGWGEVSTLTLPFPPSTNPLPNGQGGVQC